MCLLWKILDHLALPTQLCDCSVPTWLACDCFVETVLKCCYPDTLQLHCCFGMIVRVWGWLEKALSSSDDWSEVTSWGHGSHGIMCCSVCCSSRSYSVCVTFWEHSSTKLWTKHMWPIAVDFFFWSTKKLAAKNRIVLCLIPGKIYFSSPTSVMLTFVWWQSEANFRSSSEDLSYVIHWKDFLSWSVVRSGISFEWRGWPFAMITARVRGNLSSCLNVYTLEITQVFSSIMDRQLKNVGLR